MSFRLRPLRLIALCSAAVAIAGSAAAQQPASPAAPAAVGQKPAAKPGQGGEELNQQR